MITVIENEQLRVGVATHYGARVVSLFDKTADYEWMPQGRESGQIGEDASYQGDEAVGWDECFPTVSPWDATQTPWRRRLRDHGDLWGRPWDVESQTGTAIATTYSDTQFCFTRQLTLDGLTLVADYAVENKTGTSLPYLWALHALLAAAPGDHIELPEGSPRASYLAVGGHMLTPGPISWSGQNETLGFALDTAQPHSSRFAGKFLLSDVPGGRARIGRPGRRLEISWDTSISALGVWLTYAGWPADGSHYEVALEPTNAAADHLGEAERTGAVPLAPGERRIWIVKIKVGA